MTLDTSLHASGGVARANSFYEGQGDTLGHALAILYLVWLSRVGGLLGG